jgi:hypothetical protein
MRYHKVKINYDGIIKKGAPLFQDLSQLKMTIGAKALFQVKTNFYYGHKKKFQDKSGF